MKTITLYISGMTCVGCGDTIKNALAPLRGIASAHIDYEKGEGYVSYEPEQITPDEIAAAIDAIGHYKVTKIEELANNSTTSQQHLVIIGGGSAAFAAAIEANAHGVGVTMINHGLPIGGTCVNVGCVPSKHLIRAAETLYKANHNPFEGIESHAKLKSFSQLIAHKEHLVAQLRQEKYIDILQQLEHVELIEAHATIRDAHTVQAGERLIKASHILIATGASPAIPHLKGLESVDYVTNEELFALNELPKSMIIVGGSYIGLEVAQLFSRLGTKVTILQRSEHILSHEDSDVAEALADYLKEEGVRIVTGAALEEVAEEEGQVAVIATIDGQTQRFHAEKLMLATGRKPNSEGLGLENIGVDVDQKGGVVTNAFMQTSVPHIYAAGDVTGKAMFVYTAAYEAKLAVTNMFASQKGPLDLSVLSWVIFTDPQVAGVGLNENEAKKQGLTYDTATLPLTHVPRAIAAEDTRGFIKLLRDKQSDRLIGARIVAPEGSELLMEIALAMKYGIKVSDLKAMLHPYLTLSEGIKLAAIMFDKDVTALSCCAT